MGGNRSASRSGTIRSNAASSRYARAVGNTCTGGTNPASITGTGPVTGNRDRTRGRARSPVNPCRDLVQASHLVNARIGHRIFGRIACRGKRRLQSGKLQQHHQQNHIDEHHQLLACEQGLRRPRRQQHAHRDHNGTEQVPDRRRKAHPGRRAQRLDAVARRPHHQRPGNHLEQRRAQTAQHLLNARQRPCERARQQNADGDAQKRPVEHMLDAQPPPSKRDGEQRDQGEKRHRVVVVVASGKPVAQKPEHHGRENQHDDEARRDHLAMRALDHSRHRKRIRSQGQPPARPAHGRSAEADHGQNQSRAKGRARKHDGAQRAQQRGGGVLGSEGVQRECAKHAERAGAHHRRRTQAGEQAHETHAQRRADGLDHGKRADAGHRPGKAAPLKRGHGEQGKAGPADEEQKARHRRDAEKPAHVAVGLLQEATRRKIENEIDHARAYAHGKRARLRRVRPEQLPVGKPNAREHAGQAHNRTHSRAHIAHAERPVFAAHIRPLQPLENCDFARKVRRRLAPAGEPRKLFRLW